VHVSVTGVSHHETPVELRERFAFSAEQLTPALQRLPAGLGGGVLLSTCNRTELYLAPPAPAGLEEAVLALAAARGEPVPEAVTFYHHEGEEAVRHLYRVAAGVESLVVGESEILGQVREAFSSATAAGSGNAALARLFHTALRTGRRARSETEIGAHGGSIAALGVGLSRRLVGDLRRKTVLVVGAGEMGRRAAAALVQNGVGRLLVTTRRSGLAEEIARELNGVAIPMSDLGRTLAEADVLIAATAAPSAIISAQEVAAAMASRPERPLLIVDIAVPRDVDAACRGVPNVHLFDIDDLESAAQVNLEARRGEIAAVEVIVEQEVRRFEAWLAGQGVAPTIAALRQRAEAVRRAELERTLARLGHLSDADRERIDAMTEALVNRLLHEPMARLRRDGADRHIDALRELYGLDEGSTAG
jgi:glutamyl-tRNA reductase